MSLWSSGSRVASQGATRGAVGAGPIVVSGERREIPNACDSTFSSDHAATFVYNHRIPVTIPTKEALARIYRRSRGSVELKFNTMGTRSRNPSGIPTVGFLATVSPRVQYRTSIVPLT